MKAARQPPPILVKLYPGARLYDATHGRYVSVAEIRDWVTKGVAFSVIDAATGREIAPRGI